MECLETRLAPSATPASLVAPEWFRDVSNGLASLGGSASGWSALSDNHPPALATDSSQVSDWIVRFRESALAGIASVEQTASLLVGSGVEFQVLRGLGLVGQVLVRAAGVSPDLASTVLAANPNISGFEQDAIHQFNVMPNDPQVGQLWGMENQGQTGGTSDADIDAAAAWGISTGSRNVVVAVIDTGVDWRHPDLAANLWVNAGEVANGLDDDGNGLVDDVYGYNFAANTGDPMDDNGHGTHVAGTIAAVGDNGVGVAGVNWSGSIMALKFLRADGSGTTSDAIRAINYATMQRVRFGVNVRVINMSWGGGGFSSALRDAIQAAGDAGILAVAAAGNSARNNDLNPQYPSSYDCSTLVAVAATDSRDQLASFSNYGASSVDLAAPGVSILSTYPNNRYVTLSGTSMATPHVAGVAALAWSVAPNATVAEIKNALLAGVDRVSSLSGKVLTGGRLNAYNTLRLLNPAAPASPVINTLVITPSTLTAGAVATLTAQGVHDPDGAVSGVWFYQDANGNGQWDSADRALGSTTTIVGQQASFTLNTAGYAPGTYRVFARAQDATGLWSNTASTTFQVLAADDHGNDAATATVVPVGSRVAGEIEYGGDRDWFRFTATAGRQYVFFTQLNTLRDSVLTLYGPDGVTKIAVNDDAPGRGLASEVRWTAPTSGTFYLEVQAYSSSQIGKYTLAVLGGANTAPELSPIANQTMSVHQDAISVVMTAVDREGDPLTFSAEVVPNDPLARRAYELDQRLKLGAPSALLQNRLRLQEKWMRGEGNAWYFILPNGELRHWTGSAASSPAVATLSRDYWVNPRLLYNARPTPAIIPAEAVVLGVQGNVLTINPADGLVGQFQVRVTVSDGALTDAKVFTVTVGASSPSASAIATFGLPMAPLTVSTRAIDLALGGYAEVRSSGTGQSTTRSALTDQAALRVESLRNAAGFDWSVLPSIEGSLPLCQPRTHDAGLALFLAERSVGLEGGLSEPDELIDRLEFLLPTFGVAE
jgi:subtilisin family serine protease